jgi:hypothetical protein
MKHIFEQGRPARCWSPGSTSVTQEDADYWLLTEAQHEEFAWDGDVNKPMVIRCANFRARQVQSTRMELFEKLTMHPNKFQVDVQRYGKQHTTESYSIAKAIEMWEDRPFEFSDQNPPLNWLNLSNHRQGIQLTGLVKQYTMLAEACEMSDQMNRSNFGKGDTGTVATDIRNSFQFTILAQRGAVSSWYMDTMGVWTWVTLQGNKNDDTERDEDVLKYWQIIPLFEISPQART